MCNKKEDENDNSSKAHSNILSTSKILRTQCLSGFISELSFGGLQAIPRLVLINVTDDPKKSADFVSSLEFVEILSHLFSCEMEENSKKPVVDMDAHT